MLGLRAGSRRRQLIVDENGSRVPLAITLSEQVVQELDQFAAENGLTREEAARLILQRALEEESQP